jgi:hypothetical protein
MNEQSSERTHKAHKEYVTKKKINFLVRLKKRAITPEQYDRGVWLKKQIDLAEANRPRTKIVTHIMTGIQIVIPFDDMFDLDAITCELMDGEK